jgi:hypothetical protein
MSSQEGQADPGLWHKESDCKGKHRRGQGRGRRSNLHMHMCTSLISTPVVKEAGLDQDQVYTYYSIPWNFPILAAHPHAGYHACGHVLLQPQRFSKGSCNFGPR